MQEKVKIICGATASGKSSRAIVEAIKNKGVIINADSQQVYRELPILTACPNDDDMKKVPHRLYGFINGNDRMDVAKWCEFARAEIQKCFSEKKVPYIVGGTGFYIKALTEGLSVIPSVPPKIREIVRREGLNAKCSDLMEILRKYDPDLANKISPNDRQRILRGIEVFRATGIPLSSWHKNKKIKPVPGAEFEIDFVDFEMCELERRIKIRAEMMFDMGVVEEVKNLYTMGYDEEKSSIFKVIGVRDIKDFVDGKISLSECMERVILLTRQYAKRQRTFFRTQILSIKENLTKNIDI